jgi:hypothetical protein
LLGPVRKENELLDISMELSRYEAKSHLLEEQMKEDATAIGVPTL